MMIAHYGQRSTNTVRPTGNYKTVLAAKKELLKKYLKIRLGWKFTYRCTAGWCKIFM